MSEEELKDLQEKYNKVAKQNTKFKEDSMVNWWVAKELSECKEKHKKLQGKVEFLEKENKELKERVKSMNNAWSKLCPGAERLEKRRKEDE